ncbi:MAG: hypothetical protein BV458_09925 [Thermoplasmata archaeon M9B2D]|nr:MAG: hypothetical protein BV458_09925 [Thermoplasmata archaeon M9B2D]
MTPEQLIAIGAAVLSLLMEYIPPFSTWYEKLAPGYKRLFMAGLLFVIVGAVFGLSCAGLLAVFVCSWVGVWAAVQVWLMAIAINQGIHLVFKKP